MHWPIMEIGFTKVSRVSAYLDEQKQTLGSRKGKNVQVVFAF